MEMYETQNAAALSPTLTSSHLLIASALTVQRRGNVPGGRTMLDLSHGHFALLTRADAASLTSLVVPHRCSSSTLSVRVVLSRMRTFARKARWRRGRPSFENVGAVRTRQPEAGEEDVSDFSSDTNVLGESTPADSLPFSPRRCGHAAACVGGCVGRRCSARTSAGVGAEVVGTRRDNAA
ncbi:hypothetical protein NQL31_002684 [Lotmaria passim]